MKKKIFAIMLCIAMLAIAIVGGTLAYFTDDDAVANVMTVGNVDITLNEEVSDDPILPYDDVEGMKLDNKVVNVTNNSNGPVYVRTLVAFEDTNSAADLMHMEYDKALDNCYYWIENVMINGIQYDIGVFTYPDALAAGATSGDSLCGVWIDADATNEWRDNLGANGTYDVLVLAQAVQALGWAEGTTAAEALDAAFDIAEIADWFAAIAP